MVKQPFSSTSTHLIYRGVEARVLLLLLLMLLLVLELVELRLTSSPHSPVCGDGLRQQMQLTVGVHHRGTVLRRRPGRPRHVGG